MQKHKRNPDVTHKAILEAAGKLLAKDGPEGLTVSHVAQLAGVSRGAAYLHFENRAKLLKAATSWISERLRQTVFGEQPPGPPPSLAGADSLAVRMAKAAMESPGLGRLWLFDLLNSRRPVHDPLWHEYRRRFEDFAKTDMAQPGIDTEVHVVVMLISTFLWPLWARAQGRTTHERRQLAKRFSDEMLRLSRHGTMRPEKFPELSARLAQSIESRKPSKSAWPTVVREFAGVAADAPSLEPAYREGVDR